MKKLLSVMIIAFSMVTITQTWANATDTNTLPNRPHPNFTKPDKEQMRKQFEQRLQLTDKQKEKAKKLHEKGRAEMEPIMKKMKAKHEQMQKIQQANLSEEEKNKQLEQVRTEIKALNKQAKELRKQNSEDFEKILNKSQKAELEKMKSEGRAKFEKKHKARPPFQGLGTPGFFFKPLVPQTENK